MDSQAQVKDATKDYHVLPESSYCSCHDYVQKCLTGQLYLCKHLLAAALSQCLPEVPQTDIQDEEFTPLYLATTSHKLY